MLDKHSIRLIEVLTKNKVFRVELSQSEKLEAEFKVEESDIAEAKEFLNLHGL